MGDEASRRGSSTSKCDERPPKLMKMDTDARRHVCACARCARRRRHRAWRCRRACCKTSRLAAIPSRGLPRSPSSPEQGRLRGWTRRRALVRALVRPGPSPRSPCVTGAGGSGTPTRRTTASERKGAAARAPPAQPGGRCARPAHGPSTAPLPREERMHLPPASWNDATADVLPHGNMVALRASNAPACCIG